jgi:hypothetical protein
VDGTTLRLPATDEVTDVFGQMEPAQSAPVTLARASHLYDPLNGLVHDAVIAPYRCDERSLLIEHLGRLDAGSLLLLDAGYPAFWLFAAFHARKIGWCARMPLDTWGVVRDFLTSGISDAPVTLAPTPDMRRECARHAAAAPAAPHPAGHRRNRGADDLAAGYGRLPRRLSGGHKGFRGNNRVRERGIFGCPQGAGRGACPWHVTLSATPRTDKKTSWMMRLFPRKP